MRAILDGFEFYDEYKESVRKRKKPSTDDQEKEVIYCTRCHLVSLRRNYPKFVKFIRDNEYIFSKMDSVSKECMRRLCHNTMQSYATGMSSDNLDLFDRVFGTYIPENRSSTIYVDKSYSYTHDDPPMTLDEQVVAYANTTYQTFIEWISDPIIQSQLSERPDLLFEVKNTIDMNRLHNFVIVPNKGFREYHPNDELIFSKVLDSMNM